VCDSLIQTFVISLSLSVSERGEVLLDATTVFTTFHSTEPERSIPSSRDIRKRERDRKGEREREESCIERGNKRERERE
jgi:hypothetical protein